MTGRFRFLRRAAAVLAIASALAGTPLTAGEIVTVMPQTPAGAIAQSVIAHINREDPVEVRVWAPKILAPDMDEAMRDAFLDQLAVAVRDSGGVDFVDARTQGPPGMLVVTIKGRLTGKLAALVLMPDPEAPERLAMVDLVPVDDPALYADWPEAAGSQAEVAALARQALDRLAQTTDFSGCLSMTDGTEIFFEECRGLADRTFGTQANSDTKFLVGSIGKMFTAVAIGQLVESGKLDWDTTLADAVPEYPGHAAAEKVTVWQLLRHTAGLGDIFVPEFYRDREAFVHPSDYLELIARQPAKFEPGADWNYSNAGYVLLGRIVENASGEDYFGYIQRHIFDPAGMGASGFASQDDIVPGLATGYFREGAFAKDWRANWMTLPFKGSPAGGGHSTARDLLAFAAALRTGKLLSPATLEKMFSDGVPVGPGAYTAGFGERLSNGRHIRGHAGGAPGMSANLAVVWETGASVAITSNQGDTPTAMLLSERLADLLAAHRQIP